MQGLRCRGWARTSSARQQHVFQYCPLLHHVELHDTPYIFIHHTSSWQPHQPTPYDAEPIRTIGLAIRIPYFNSFCMLRCYRNHSAFNSHNFPRSCTTTYPYVAAQPQPNALTRKAQGFGNYLRQIVVLAALFHAASFHSIFSPVSFAAVSAQGFARPLAGLLATHLAIVYSVYSAYLPGLHAARPSAFVAVEGIEPSLMVALLLVAPFTSLSLPECLAVPPRVNHITPFSTIL